MFGTGRVTDGRSMNYALPADQDTCEICAAWTTDTETHIAANEHAIGLVSPRPRAVGAVIVVPRAHAHSPSALTSAQMAATWRMVQRVTWAIEAAFDPDGMHTWHDIGNEAQASFAHLSIDLVPRHYGAPYQYRPWAELAEADRETRLASARTLRSALDQAEQQSCTMASNTRKSPSA
jgi:diadenosine tetraphosphate (Ap4A) HIT family hydrolase